MVEVNVNAILACDAEGGIGKNNDLPWPKNELDMKWFKKNTSCGVVVMGRKTWESLGSKCLPKRINVVVSSSDVEGPDHVMGGDIKEIISNIRELYPQKQIWIIGGANLYEQSFEHCDYVYLTEMTDTYDCDTFIDRNKFKRSHSEISHKDYEGMRMSVWEKWTVGKF